MHDRPEVVLTGFTSKTVPHSRLSEEDLKKLRELKAVSISGNRHGYALKAGDTSGVIQLSRVRLVLQPKLPVEGRRLIHWLCYANRQPEPNETLRNWPIGRDGYAGLVPAALLNECRQLLEQGLRRDYVLRRSVDTTLRGRLDVEAQATRCYGAVNRLHLQTFEYEDGSWENLVCGAALTVASQRSTDPRQTQMLLEAAARFPTLRQPMEALSLLARAQYTQLNLHYRPAHAWARMVLGGGGVTDLLNPYGNGAKSLLLRLDRLWENVVQRMAVDAATELGGRAARMEEGKIVTSGGIGDRKPPFRPDVLMAFPPLAEGTGQSRFLAVDAKYKGYAEKNVDSTDRHQLLTYIVGYTDPDHPVALVVYPSPQGAVHRNLRIEGPRGLMGIIKVLGLDTRLAPKDAAEPLRRSMAAFASANSL
ncbi:PE-PGRS family protein [Streptomyces smyrnaeus]|uniref:5-methylcytosine restriction system specificity protein McrC n=1 Tax=Streptomyces smyrnaeus TaxID=1387713 RepID=UPI0036C52C1C